MTNKSTYLVLLLLSFHVTIQGQRDANYDEAKVPEYSLPMIFENGQEPSKDLWETRRVEIMTLFQQQVYGVNPAMDVKVSLGAPNTNTLINQGTVRMMEYTISIKTADGELPFNLLLFLPAEASKPVPVFLGLNFMGNHTIHPNENILLASGWVRDNKEMATDGNQATAAGRGKRARRWPAEAICAEGFGLATIYYGDFDPDFDDGFENGIHGMVESARNDSSWGSIATWAWGLSRAMDALVDMPFVDSQKVIVFGHSRLGKASLWAGATDARFAMVISNNSGCGGAALSRRRFGEKVKRINSSFPHWFAKNFHQYNDKESSLPVDQHMLLALSAPRPLYVASAVEDQWADPKGEYLALHHASQVYSVFDQNSTLNAKMPPVDVPKWAGKLGYHIRSGKHDVTLYDWQQYMDFARIQFQN